MREDWRRRGLQGQREKKEEFWGLERQPVLPGSEPSTRKGARGNQLRHPSPEHSQSHSLFTVMICYWRVLTLSCPAFRGFLPLCLLGIISSSSYHFLHGSSSHWTSLSWSWQLPPLSLSSPRGGDALHSADMGVASPSHCL